MSKRYTGYLHELMYETTHVMKEGSDYRSFLSSLTSLLPPFARSRRVVRLIRKRKKSCMTLIKLDSEAITTFTTRVVQNVGPQDRLWSLGRERSLEILICMLSSSHHHHLPRSSPMMSRACAAFSTPCIRRRGRAITLMESALIPMESRINTKP
jgi:hypothetical protein